MPATEHRIKWHVVVDGERYPHTSGMRGAWDYEATCSCGWDSRTGGAVRSFVQTMVNDHKRETQA